MIMEFLKRKFHPRDTKRENFILLYETTDEERRRNHGRLPKRFWLVLFPSAGAAKPYAVVDEWDDGRPTYDLTDNDAHLTDEILEFWYNCSRRPGDH
jgi:hypothetical protein